MFDRVPACACLPGFMLLASYSNAGLMGRLQQDTDTMRQCPTQLGCVTHATANTYALVRSKLVYVAVAGNSCSRIFLNSVNLCVRVRPAVVVRDAGCARLEWRVSIRVLC